MSSSPPNTTTVTTTYLEIRDPAAIVPARPVGPQVQLIRAEEPSPEFARFLYTAVGGDWHWTDRLNWTWRQWYVWLEEPGRELWYLARRGTPLGFFVLDTNDRPSVEIAYLGLVPQSTGQGLGGWLLEQALRRGFSLGSRVWLHTCSLDHPGALAAYQARGLTPYASETDERIVGGASPGPWPGAHRPARIVS